MKRFLFLIFIVMPILAMSQSDFDKAEKLFSANNFEQSRVLFESYLKENPNNLKTLEYLGDIEGHNKSWDKAIYYYKKLKQIKPSEANYFYKYGGVLGMKAKDSNKFAALGMISDVKAAFEKAIILNPKHLEARWALIELYLQLPGIVGGSERKALNYANELSGLSTIDGYLAKGHIAEYFERYLEAEKHYKKAVEIGKSKKSYQILSNLYKNKMRQPEKAKSVLEDFEKLKI
jgi:tetratricopeptide (TPR) repeat protein